MIKSDIEVYAGFYLVVTFFIGGNSLLAIFFYWQMMRMRYMMNPNLQGSFGKLDVLFQEYLNHPYCPGILRTVYFKIREFASSIVDVQAQQQRVQESGGGMMGALKNSCSIF